MQLSYLEKLRRTEKVEEKIDNQKEDDNVQAFGRQGTVDPTYEADDNDRETDNHEDKEPSSSRPKRSLHLFSLACDRYEISDRAAACLASALLLDLVLISAEDTSLFIDRNAVRRARQKVRETLEDKEENREPSTIFFERKEGQKNFENGKI